MQSNLRAPTTQDMDGTPSPFADGGPAAVSDVDAVRAILVATARAGRSISYSELLASLGHRFTRPKMRALCKTLEAIDRAGSAAGEPELAVLVVRESDGLPGQGWWVGSQPARHAYDGAWTGQDATAFVRRLQQAIFVYWANHAR